MSWSLSFLGAGLLLTWHHKQFALIKTLMWNSRYVAFVIKKVSDLFGDMMSRKQIKNNKDEKLN